MLILDYLALINSEAVFFFHILKPVDTLSAHTIVQSEYYNVVKLTIGKTAVLCLWPTIS